MTHSYLDDYESGAISAVKIRYSLNGDGIWTSDGVEMLPDAVPGIVRCECGETFDDWLVAKEHAENAGDE